MWKFQFRNESMRIPKYFTWVDGSIFLPSILMVMSHILSVSSGFFLYIIGLFSCLNIRTLVLLAFNNILLAFNHLHKYFRSRLIWSWIFLMHEFDTKRLVSSTKWWKTLRVNFNGCSINSLINTGSSETFICKRLTGELKSDIKRIDRSVSMAESL